MYYSNQFISQLSDSLFSSFCPPLEKTNYEELSVLLGVLQATSIIHQSAHWTASSENREGFYAQHLLFERLYNTSSKSMDGLAERILGLSNNDSLVAPTKLLKIQYAVVGAIEALDNVESVERSWAVENLVVSVIHRIKQCYDRCNKLTDGLSNLLESIADNHEQNLYLLGRSRVKGCMKQIVSHHVVKHDAFTGQH